MHTIHCLGQRVPEVDHVLNPDCNGLFQNQYLLSLAAQMARNDLELRVVSWFRKQSECGQISSA